MSNNMFDPRNTTTQDLHDRAIGASLVIYMVVFFAGIAVGIILAAVCG